MLHQGLGQQECPPTLVGKGSGRYQKGIKAVDGYLAIGGADQSPKTGPVDSTLALAQASAWEADLPAMA